MKNDKIIINGFSDGEHYFTMLAHNDNTERNFKKDWDDAIKKVKKKSPEDWQLVDVEKTLEKIGWVFEVAKTVEVSY